MKSDNNVDIFFLGDTYFGEWHMRLRARKSKHDILKEKGYLHFGKNFEKILEDADEVILNLECTITDIKVSPLVKTNKNHLYSAQEDGTISALKALNVSTVMLANNHAVDFGKAGLMDTIRVLEDANIKYIGGGINQEEAERPLFFDKKCGNKIFKTAIVSCYNYGSASEEFGFYAKENIPGVNKQSLTRISNQVTKIKNEERERFFIVSPHWGPNYVWRTFGQQQMSEKLIDVGVDLIVGHSAHMLQEIEYYKKCLVLYSIGNFILNGDGEYKRRNLPPYSFIARLNVQCINGEFKKKMIIYPIHSDNTSSDFTPRFVNYKEFNQVQEILRSHNFNPDIFDSTVFISKDEYGFYIEYPIYN